MKRYSIFGSKGFIGTQLTAHSNCVPVEVNFHDRGNLPSPTNNIIYLRSTNHNYNPLDNNPYIDIETNCRHPMDILQAARVKFGKDFEFTYVSTWFVYGNTQCPASEDAYCDPKGFYSITKLAGEKLVQSYCETFGIPWKVVRLSNVLGVGDGKISKRRNALQYMIKTLCDNKEVELYKGDCYRDYIHVSDAARGILAVAESGIAGNVYNIGSGKGHLISGMVNRAHDRCRRGTIKLIDVPDFHKQVQVDNMWLNVNKVLEDTGWKATIPVEQIVDDLVDYYVEHSINES